MNQRALWLLLLGAVVHYGYALAPEAMQARIWNIGGSFGRAALILALVWRVRDVVVLAVAGWWLLEESLVMGCNTAYLIAPWPIDGAACSGLLTLDFGKVGIAAVALLLVAIRR